jgi:hypothetical protein
VEIKELESLCESLYVSLFHPGAKAGLIGRIDHKIFPLQDSQIQPIDSALIEKAHREVDAIAENAGTEEGALTIFQYFGRWQTFPSKAWETGAPMRKLIRTIRKCAKVHRDKERREYEERINKAEALAVFKEQCRANARFNQLMKAREHNAKARVRDTARRVAILATMPHLTSIPSG